ncbi:MAG: sulfatase-like hydrolase/transferase [Phycisphaerae bacterium]|nr:sulfatase-like hydrolase/transferase [Phycisphaerae bacterium]
MAGEADRRPSTTPRPNVVILLADDLGYGDLACYGHPVIKTPNIDRLAAEGVRFTDCYAAAANCSPARAGLMTGRTPYRVGIHNWIPDGSPMHLRRQEITIATLLRRAGYATCHVGKWHLNGKFNSPDQPQPGDHGFDHWFSTQNNALPCHHNPDNFVRNGKPVGPLQGYSAQIVADEAIHWLKSGRDPDKPFFLYVCFHEPHEPIATDKRFADLYASLNNPGQAAHHGSVTQMDHAVGRLMQTLDAQNLRENTLVLFTSDNGPAITNWHPYGSSGPMRAKKGHLYEGGIRVPGIIRWPGHAKPGQICDEPICGVDVLPTLCAVAGVPVPADRAIDGADFQPVFEGRPIQRATPLYWQFNWAQSRPKVAMRLGDRKIVADLTGSPFKVNVDIVDDQTRALKDSDLAWLEFYNLRCDLSETTELAHADPQRLRQLSEVLVRLYRQVRDESPTWPAWKWPRLEGKRIQEYRKNHHLP